MLKLLMENWQDLAAAFGLILGACSTFIGVVSKIAPPKEGSFYSKICKLIDKGSIFFLKFKGEKNDTVVRNDLQK